MFKMKKNKKARLIAGALVLLMLITPFGDLPVTIANGVDDGVHYLNYSEDQIWTLLGEAMYPSEEEALFPLEDALSLVETPEMRESIQIQMDGKVLLEKIDRKDGCVAYLMMNPETYELALIAINSGEESHTFQLNFGVEPTDGKMETYALETVEEIGPDEKEEIKPPAEDGTVTPPIEGEDGTVTPPTEGEDGTVTPPTEGEDDAVTPPIEGEDDAVTPPTEGEDDAVTPPAEGEDDAVTPPTEGEDDAVTPPATEGSESAPSESAPATDGAPATVAERNGLADWIGTVATVFTASPAMAAEATPADNGGGTETTETTTDGSADSESTTEPSSPSDDVTTGDDGNTPPDAVTPPSDDTITPGDDTTTPGAPSEDPVKEPEEVIDPNAPPTVIITEEALPQVEAVPMEVTAKGVGVVSFSMPMLMAADATPISSVKATLYDYTSGYVSNLKKTIPLVNKEIRGRNGDRGDFFIGSGSGSNGYSDGQWNKWTNNDGGVYLGLAESKLVGGASGDIQFTHGTGKVNLFPDPQDRAANGIEVYPVDFPLVNAGDGYFEYDSNDNYHVELNKKTGNLAFKDGKQSLNGKSGFFPFNETKGNPNYYFGMKLGFDFMMPKDGLVNGEPMIFEFRGDDDVWIFIDGQLVLDIGGIHDAYEGSIDFRSGEITYPKVYNGSAPTANLYKELGIDQTNYKEHTLTMFYMERGAGESNCKVKFNLPTIPKDNVNVTKTVEGLNDTVAGQTDYQFKLYTGENGESVDNLYRGSYTVSGSSKTTDKDGIFTIKGGQTASFPDLAVDTYYKVEEIVDQNGGYTPHWTVKDSDTKKDGSISPVLNVGDQAFVTCINKYPVNPDLPDLVLKKQVNGSLADDDITYNFKIMLNDKPYSGYILDGNGNKKLISDGKESLKKNQTAKIVDLPEGTKYTVTELNLDPNVYQTPGFTINGESAEVTPSTTPGNSGTNYTVTGEIAWLELDENGKPINENQDSRIICTNTNLDNGKIVVTKHIDQNRVAHGDPIYVITLEQLDPSGKVLSSNHQYVRFENGSTTNQSVTFDNLVLGNYRVKESQALRYEFTGISDNSGNATPNDEEITFNLTAIAPEGTATFSDTKYQEQWFSHTDVESSSFILKPAEDAK